MKSIIGIDQLDEFIINNNNNNILLLYFGTNRCSPCNILKERIIKESSSEMPKLSVCYIDIDLKENGELIDIYCIKVLPTQIFVKLKEDKVIIISEVVGYDWIKLLMTYKDIYNKDINNKDIKI
jgi:thioredoxin-related protein